MQDNSSENQNRNLLSLYFHAWKDLHLSQKMKWRANVAALVHYAFNTKLRFFLLWRQETFENRKLGSSSLVIQAKRNLALKRTVFRAIKIILDRKDLEMLFTHKILLAYIKILYNKSFEAWKNYLKDSQAKKHKQVLSLLFWKERILKKYFWLFKNWKSLMPDKAEMQREYAELSKVLWKKVFISKLKGNLQKKQEVIAIRRYIKLGRAFGLHEKICIRKSFLGWTQYLQDKILKEKMKTICKESLKRREERMLQRFFGLWKETFEDEKDKERRLEELIQKEWSQKSLYMSKKRVFDRIRNIINDKEKFYRSFSQKQVLKRAFVGWKQRLRKNLKYLEILRKLKQKRIRKYFQKLRQYKDQCIIKRERNLKAQRLCVRKTRERLFKVWREEFMWAEKVNNVEQKINSQKEHRLKASLFQKWKEVIKKTITLREKTYEIRIRRIKGAWGRLIYNYHEGKKADERNRKARRFRYLNLLRYGIKILKKNVERKAKKRIDEERILEHNNNQMKKKAWDMWRLYIIQRKEKKRDTVTKTKALNDGLIGRVFEAWKLRLQDRKEERLLERKSRRYFAMKLLIKVMRRWKIFYSIRKEKVHYARELENTVKKCLAMRRLRIRTFQLKQDREKIQQSLTRFILTRKRNNFIQFTNNTLDLIRIRKLEKEALFTKEFNLKKKSFEGFILNKRRVKRERKMLNVALDQWCFYRYKRVFNRLRLYMESEHRKNEEEIRALEMRKEHIRKGGFHLNVPVIKNMFSKLIAKGLELRDRDFKKNLKRRIINEMQEYALMRKYALRWLDFYYKRTGKVRNQPRKDQTPHKSFQFNLDRSMPLALQDLENKPFAKSPVLKQQLKTKNESIRISNTNQFGQSSRKEEKKEKDGKSFKGFDTIKTDKEAPRRPDSKEPKKLGQEKPILDWFEEKHVNKQRKQPKRLPNFNPDESSNSKDLSFIPMGKKLDQERTLTDNDNFLQGLTPKKEQNNLQTNKEVAEEELEERVEILENKLTAIKRNKERLKTLKERNTEEDKKEIKVLSEVLDVQKKQAKILLEEIQKIKEALGV